MRTHLLIISSCHTAFSLASCLQRSSLDFVAISLGVVMSLRQPASELTFERPPQVLCTVRNFVMMLISVFITSMAYLGLIKYLQLQDFWQNKLPHTSVSFCLWSCPLSMWRNTQ